MKDVLVVDDSPDIRHLTELLLARGGHSVRGAGTVDEALAEVLLTPPDVILLDLQLPGRSGWDLLADLRERGFLVAIRVVLFSAQVNPKEFDRGALGGASGYLTKPFTPDQLLACVEGPPAGAYDRAPA